MNTMALRPVIGWSLAVCVAVAMAPWLTGGQRPLAMVISGGALLVAALLAWRQPAVRQLWGGPLVWAYVGLLSWGALSLMWTANRYSTVVWLVMYALAGLAFRLSYIVAGEVAGRERLVRLYLVSAGLFVAYGLYLFVTDGYERLTGSFYWANPAAAYLIPALLIALDRLDRAGRERWLWLGAGSLFGAAFWLTGSRAATAVLAVVVAIFLLTKSLNRRYWIMLLLTLIGAFLLSTISVQTRQLLQPAGVKIETGSRFAEAVTGESQSGSDRLFYLKSTADMWFARPLTGVGAGAYGDVHAQYQGRVVSASTNAHNVYAQTWAELGLVGVALLAWVLLALLVGVVRGLLVAPPGSVPLALGLLALMMHSGLDITARYPANLLLMAVLAGVLYAQWRVEWRRLSWRVPVVALALLVPLVSLYYSDNWRQRALQAQDEADYEGARAAFEQARGYVIYNPDVVSAEGINAYALALTTPGRRADYAAQALDRALQAQRLDPADAQHHQLEGRVRLVQGDLPAAERALRRALQLDRYNHPDYALDLALILIQRGHSDEALRVAEAMLNQYPAEVIANRNNDQALPGNLASLWAVVGEQRLRRGEVDRARQAADRGLEIDPTNHRARALDAQLDQLPIS